MTAGTLASWLLEQESRALLTRLEGITPFAIHETMVPAANLSPAAQLGIERTIADGRTVLHRRVLGYLSWLRGPGRTASPADQQRRFVVLRLQFNNVLSQFDLFTEVVTQRSEHGTGVWLSGLDALAADALRLPGDYFVPPAVACYLARGPGAAIRRARTRLPGGASNPIAIVKVPRERMVGHGIASSLVHEVGHQAAALLSLVPSLRLRLQAVQRELRPADRAPWVCFESWISEIAADYWSVGLLGIGSTLGLMGVVSLPTIFVFRPSGPHQLRDRGHALPASPVGRAGPALDLDVPPRAAGTGLCPDPDAPQGGDPRLRPAPGRSPSSCAAGTVAPGHHADPGPPSRATARAVRELAAPSGRDGPGAPIPGFRRGRPGPGGRPGHSRVGKPGTRRSAHRVGGTQFDRRH
jgi:hypothetical protein